MCNNNKRGKWESMHVELCERDDDGGVKNTDLLLNFVLLFNVYVQCTTLFYFGFACWT